ncbi:hypothetical protein [Paenibacillus sp. 1P07SE]|uniref:hypothetical protein n=1 Tax=Paenibacillus sp. 1P07SE TaxID=3132209 RepID=UPI0039A6FE42
MTLRQFQGGPPRHYAGVEDVKSFMRRVFDFMQDLKLRGGAAAKDWNILIAGFRCTTGAIGAFFEGIPEDGNILRLSSANGDFKVYRFA